MAHYCSKCLINPVAHEGDVCAACGGVPQSSGNSPSGTFPTYNPSPHVNRYGYNSNSSAPTAPPPSSNGGVPPVPQAPSAPQTASAQQTAPAQQACRPSKRATISGVVQNMIVGSDDRSFLTRVSDSLFKGIAYNGKSNLQKMEFQLFQSWNASGGWTSNQQPTATNVVCYGNIKQCCPTDGNDVCVEGVWDRESGALIAERIDITTSNATAVFYPPKTSAGFVRFSVFFILLILAALASFVFMLPKSTTERGVGVPFSQILTGIVMILIGIALFAGTASSRRNPRGMRFGARMLLYAIGALLIAVGVAVFAAKDISSKMESLGSALIMAIVFPGIFRIFFGLLLNPNGSPGYVDRLLTYLAVFAGVLIFITCGFNVLFE